MCGSLRIGHRLVGVLGVGGWRMSLEPINSSLTKHLRGDITRSAGLLHRESSEWLSRDRHSLWTYRKHNPDEEHHMVFEGTKLSVHECSSWQV